MKLYEIIFAAVCGILCAGALFVMTGIDEPFYTCVCAFSAAFWGSLAAFVVWGRICERERSWTPTIIWPHGRRPC